MKKWYKGYLIRSRISFITGRRYCVIFKDRRLIIESPTFEMAKSIIDNLKDIEK